MKNNQIGVHFQINANLEDQTKFEELREKEHDTQRSFFHKLIENFINKSKKKEGRPCQE